MNDNELIAEFMGYHVYRDELFGKQLQVRYHESWDWLMPVVEKIEFIGHTVDIYESSCEISYKEYCDTQTSDSKISAVYKAVVKYIKQYQ